jgi:riboflavin synthase alpha subunit
MENNNIMTKNKEVAENNYIITKNKVVPQRQNNKSYLVSIAPKLKNILVEKPSISNQVYSLTLNEVLNKDFNSLGLRRNN